MDDLPTHVTCQNCGHSIYLAGAIISEEEGTAICPKCNEPQALTPPASDGEGEAEGGDENIVLETEEGEGGDNDEAEAEAETEDAEAEKTE